RDGGPRLVVTLHDYSVVCSKKSLLYRGAECSGPGFSKCLHCAGRNYGEARGTVITMGNWLMSGPFRRVVDMFVPVSHAVARGNELAELDLPFEVVPNFVPDDILSRADAANASLAALPAAPFMLYVGTLSRHKGIYVLLDAYKQLKEAPPLVVIGRTDPEAPQTL